MGRLFWGLIMLVGMATNAYTQSHSPVPPKVKGNVREVDPAGLCVHLKHDEIPNLGIAASTMTFSVQDPDLITELAEGDWVLFSAEEIDGVLTAVWIEKQS